MTLSRTLTLTLVISLVGLLLTGCAGRGGANDDTSAITTDFHTGSEGVFMRFDNRAPPNVIYDSLGTTENEMVVVVELHNRGAVDTDVRLFLGGFDNTIIDLPTEYGEDIHLMGRSIYNSDGEFKVIQFPSPRHPNAGAVELPPNTDRYQPKLQLTACYEYWTEASPIVCISPDPYRITTEQSCRPGTVRGTFGGQGAPVAISSVQAEVVPGEVIFKIGITNSAPGRVIDWMDSKRGGACPYDLDYLDLNNIDYEVVFQGLSVLSSETPTSTEGVPNCQPSRVKLSSGKGTLFCRFPTDLTQQSAYESPIEINLHYGYMDSITRALDIRRLG